MKIMKGILPSPCEAAQRARPRQVLREGSLAPAARPFQIAGRQGHHGDAVEVAEKMSGTWSRYG